MTEFADLARWTPIWLDFSGRNPTVYWADLSSQRFSSQPFFENTVARWKADPDAVPFVRTGLDALVALDGEPSLDPAGLIFHLSRCGSTLVSRLLGELTGVVVISQPAPLSALLRLDPDQLDTAWLVELVRLVVRALGRLRHGDERQLVIKCNSWNIRRRAILAAAFPDTPWIWVQREPVRILASLLAKPTHWCTYPAEYARLFNLDPSAVAAMAPIEFAARALGANLDAVATDPAAHLCIDYGDLPEAIWRRIAPHFGLDVNAAAIQRMTEAARFYSKSPVPRVFAGDDPEERPITQAMRDAAERFVEPRYHVLASR